MASTSQQPCQRERPPIPPHRPAVWRSQTRPAPSSARPGAATPQEPEVDLHRVAAKDYDSLGGIWEGSPVNWPAASSHLPLVQVIRKDRLSLIRTIYIYICVWYVCDIPLIQFCDRDYMCLWAISGVMSCPVMIDNHHRHYVRCITCCVL